MTGSWPSFCRYRDRDGAWLETEVVNVDQTVSPPSYAVKVNGSVRETERERLSVLRPPPEGQAPAEWTLNPPTDRPKPEEPKVDWVAYKDADGAEYYHNAATGETTWDIPEALAKLREKQAPPAGSNATQGKGDQVPAAEPEEKYNLPEGVSAVIKVPGTPWSEAKLADGSGSYFFNSSNGETTWTVPPDVEKVRAEKAEAEKKKAAEAAAAPPMSMPPPQMMGQMQHMMGNMMRPPPGMPGMGGPGMPPMPPFPPGAGA